MSSCIYVSLKATSALFYRLCLVRRPFGWQTSILSDITILEYLFILDAEVTKVLQFFNLQRSSQTPPRSKLHIFSKLSLSTGNLERAPEQVSALFDHAALNLIIETKEKPKMVACSLYLPVYMAPGLTGNSLLFCCYTSLVCRQCSFEKNGGFITSEALPLWLRVWDLWNKRGLVKPRDVLFE